MSGTGFYLFSCTCECGKQFDAQRDALKHAIANDHRRVDGLLFSFRMQLEEHNHARGVCTHVEHRFDDGARTMCIARNPVVRGSP